MTIKPKSSKKNYYPSNLFYFHQIACCDHVGQTFKNQFCFQWLYFLDSIFEQEILSKIEKISTGPGWLCKDCGYVGNRKGHVYEHVEAKHVDHPAYICDLCDSVCKNRSSLRAHRNKYHKNLWENTCYCDGLNYCV